MDILINLSILDYYLLSVSLSGISILTAIQIYRGNGRQLDNRNVYFLVGCLIVSPLGVLILMGCIILYVIPLLVKANTLLSKDIW